MSTIALEDLMKHTVRAGSRFGHCSVVAALIAMSLCLGVATASQAETYSLGQLEDPQGQQMPGTACSNIDDVEHPDLPGVMGPTQTCYTREVESCTDAPSLTSDIRVTDNAGTDGTIFFFNAQGGTSFWAPNYDGTQAQEELRLQVELTTGGNDFKLVEIAHQGWWSKSTQNQKTGHGRLACRPATLVDWLIDHPNIHVSGTPACATGHSGGANQIAFMLTHYGAWMTASRDSSSREGRFTAIC